MAKRASAALAIRQTSARESIRPGPMILLAGERNHRRFFANAVKTGHPPGAPRALAC